nr:DNA-binding protein [Bacteroides togonis]
MDAIEKWAADEFRSTNGQLQWIINEALRKSGRLKEAKKRPADEDPVDGAEDKTPDKE